MVEGQLVSGNYFDVLRVAPLAGQFFDRSAGRPGGMPQVVMTRGRSNTVINVNDPKLTGF